MPSRSDKVMERSHKIHLLPKRIFRCRRRPPSQEDQREKEVRKGIKEKLRETEIVTENKEERTRMRKIEVGIRSGPAREAMIGRIRTGKSGRMIEITKGRRAIDGRGVGQGLTIPIADLASSQSPQVTVPGANTNSRAKEVNQSTLTNSRSPTETTS